MSDRENSDQEELLHEIEEERKAQAIANRENFEKNIKNLWGYSETGLEAKRAAMTMLATKTGMYAKIPIYCKADSCPYAETCPLLSYDLAPIGEPCPIETAQIELRYEAYARDFDLDDSSFTDKAIVSEIINAEIMMERAKALMSKEGVPVVDVVAGIGENGEVYTRPEVSKYWEVYEKALKKRNEAYQLMMATRKDKKGDDDGEQSITKIIAEAVIDEDFIEDVEDYTDKTGE